SPSRRPAARPTNPHEGSIVAETPNQLWGTDATATVTDEDGQVTIFAAIDHCSADCIGIHAIKRADRFEALEPIRQAVREQFGSFSAGVAAGVRLRHDNGSVYMSDDFQAEVRFLGIESYDSLRPTTRGKRLRFTLHLFRTFRHNRHRGSTHRELSAPGF